MAALPYVHDVKDMSRLLGLVLKSTTPGTLVATHLVANGFTPSAADEAVVFLEGLGLIDAEGRPTDAWIAYRDAEQPADTLQQIVREAYAPLVELTDAGPVPQTDLLARADDTDGEADATAVVATFTALCERAGISLTAPAPAAAPVRSRREVLHDVSDLMQRAVDEFEQARRCLAAELPRPAHVAAWNSFVALAFAQLADDDFSALRISPRRASLGVDELMRLVHGSELIRILVKHELVPAADKTALDDLLRQRNDCASPLPYTPDRATTATYLSAILGVSAQISGGTTSDAAAPSTPPPPTTPR
ncbi:DUF5343 domain-containing protein [Aeromicrobium wangtongii]|uniref:DUF5343 domain-containing protein n=1 Tax=Aeromicrobium wangtongii TaxID=2969247 RepID=UPI0020178563|nr:DUF5343 domain-containing protein [Aeromicrobium wangtongii]MCL3819444.1 DUF5343 domain-containing protein [Aeromicrobium wangtongii]